MGLADKAGDYPELKALLGTGRYPFLLDEGDYDAVIDEPRAPADRHHRHVPGRRVRRQAHHAARPGRVGSRSSNSLAAVGRCGSGARHGVDDPPTPHRRSPKRHSPATTGRARWSALERGLRYAPAMRGSSATWRRRTTPGRRC
ncbi:hypothetical protein ACU686_40000 [Yinghuangia aomiensis]